MALHVLFCLLILLENVYGSHFRGGIIMLRPRPGGATNEMEISFQISWRRSWSENTFCDDTTIQSGTLIGSESLSCQSGCSGNVGSLAYQCTDFSESEDWSYGGNTIYYTFPASTTITIGYSSCCWISPFDSWNLASTFSTTLRSDTSVINSTPRATTAPVLRVQSGCNHEIQIPVTDPDSDIVKCRWGSGTECESVCDGIPGAVLDSESCTISYLADQGTGYKAVALAIEDFTSNSSSTPLSTVNLQFLVFVFDSSQPCSAIPELVPPTLMQGICVAVIPGATFNTQVVADTQSSTVSISEFVTTSPSGTIKGSIHRIQNSTLYYVNISWTPTSDQQHQTHSLCYRAVNSHGISSEQVCIKIDAGILAPEPNMTSLSPASGEIVFPSNTTWSIQFDRSIQRPSISAFITFHSSKTNEVVHEIDTSFSSEVAYVEQNRLQITPNFTFPEKQSFYINFQQGAVISLVGCEAGNHPINAKNFWTFQIQGVSEPVNVVIYPSTVPNFHFGSEVTATCFATGIPLPAVKWYKDDNLFSANNEISVTQTTSGDGTNVTSVLTIFSLSDRHEGIYTCNGSNILANGTVAHSIAVFKIKLTESKLCLSNSQSEALIIIAESLFNCI